MSIISLSVLLFCLSAASCERIFKAARSHENLVKKSNDISLTYEVDLVYAEETPIITDDGVFTARLHAQSESPVLFLEEFDHLLSEVDCTGSEMRLVMRESDSFNQGLNACSSLIDGLVVSSHFTCSDEEAHSVFRVLNVGFDKERLSIVLQLEESTLQKAFSVIKFDFRQSVETYHVQQHNRHSRRQASTTVESIVAAPTGTLIPDDTTNKASLGFSYINTTFMVPDIFGNNYSLPFDFGCANCTSKGDLTLTTASIELNSLGELINGTDDDLIKSGFARVDLTGFEMSIGLRVTPSPEEDLQQDIDVFGYEIIGVRIPGVGHIGLEFVVALHFEATVDRPVELGFGFDVTVPDSYILADIAETQKSNVSGFNPTLTSHILSSNDSSVEVSVRAGLRPKFLAGITLFVLDLNVGPFLSLPDLVMNVTQLRSSDVGANCEQGGDTDPKFQEQFGNLTHVEYGLEMAAGIEFPIIDPVTIVSVPFSLTTQCLAYKTDGPTTGLSVATAVLAEFKPPEPTGGGEGKDAKGSAGRLSSSFILGGWEGVCGGLVALAWVVVVGYATC